MESTKQIDKKKLFRLLRHIHVGRRTLKTVAAVIVSIILVSFYGVSASKMTFAMLGAMSAMENTFRRSIRNCLTQIVGMLCGAAVGLLLLQLPMHWLVCVGIGMVLIITTYNFFRIPFAPSLPCMIILTVCTTTDMQPFAYAIERLWDTTIGLGVGMLINVLVLPYDNSFKIRNSIEWLKEEVIAFLEDMFDGDSRYPDTEKLTASINEMHGELGILSEQWFPLRRKQNARRLAILRECEAKSRQLLSHMEVLSQMKTLGCLDEENRLRLASCGANIGMMQSKGACVADVITNYHVKCILMIRQELMEELMQFPAKRRITQKMPIYENEYKSIYTGVSAEFGKVILKNDSDIAGLKSEYYMLARLNGHHSCKVYAFHEEKGQLLEERILPGTKLREERDLEKRLRCFAEVFSAIHIPVSEGFFGTEDENQKDETLSYCGMGTYLDWLEKVRKFCVDEKNEIWLSYVNRACDIAKVLFDKYPERVLLHGDLHHDNLLLRENGEYVFVDPKGVVGPKIFDLPRFILNELDTEHEEEDVVHIRSVIARLSDMLHYPKEDIKALFYMETVLANVWNIEDGKEPDERQMRVAKLD